MFGSLKKKLSGWFGKKDEEEKVEEAKEENVEVKEKESSEEKAPTQTVSKPEKITKKPKKEKVKAKKAEEEVLPEEQDEEGLEEAIKEEADKIEREASLKFETGKLKYEPDLEAVKEETPGEELVEEEKKSFWSWGKKKKEEVKEEVKEVVETPSEELKEEFDEEEKGGFFSKLKKKLSTSELKQEEFDELFEELEMILLENNVALVVVDKIRENLKNELVGKQFKKSEVEEKILDALKGAIDSVLIEGEDLLLKIKGKKNGPFVILFFGINGSGKTTSIAKLAWKLKEKGISCVLGAGDTFRAASIEQLETHANRLGVPIVKGEYGKDPSAVGFDTIIYAKKHGIKVVLIDTAGRMYTKSNLLKEMEKIVKVTKPDLKIFVGESITGNDATEQAKTFNETVGIDGIILSKADVDEKAGTILSVSYVTGKSIYYLGVGQGYKDLKEFKKEDVLKGLGLD